ncbi:hypothetical protein RS130_15820 [Paraglaciecola aquimarina]|uniref:Lipoprotein n=1 Tax=Paraglaciecola aquimarina TaxID=1235557 RepID=A0ABU3SYU2_9ALTE|nr:hypothetical protein [Paraglaciecola aquimarina]MDU0355174.1 hypothetical protein [Paraglaciecola aquimarina]
MEKIILSVAMILTLLLSACGQTESQKNNPIYVETPPKEIEQPFIRVVFNPMSGDINIPNDLLMMPSTDLALFDFTLNTEGQATFDSSDPQHSLSALDGWSAHTPIELRVEAGIDMDIDPASINGDAIKLFEATQALQGTSAEC